MRRWYFSRCFELRLQVNVSVFCRAWCFRTSNEPCLSCLSPCVRACVRVVSTLRAAASGRLKYLLQHFTYVSVGSHRGHSSFGFTCCRIPTSPLRNADTRKCGVYRGDTLRNGERSAVPGESLSFRTGSGQGECPAGRETHCGGERDKRRNTQYKLRFSQPRRTTACLPAPTGICITQRHSAVRYRGVRRY